jgi:hypothetical protein
MIMLTRKKSSCFINPHKNGPFDALMQNATPQKKKKYGVALQCVISS